MWFDVPANPSEVGEARRKLRMWLNEQSVAGGDDATLVLSELVTNVLQHAKQGCTVAIVLDEECVHIDVYDATAAPPILKEPQPNDLGGWGLRVVDAIATSWGWEARDDGKRVWADVSLGLPARA